MTETENKRKEIIQNLREAATPLLTEILYNITNELEYYDDTYWNKLDRRLVFTARDLVNVLDDYTNQLEEVNKGGKKSE